MIIIIIKEEKRLRCDSSNKSQSIQLTQRRAINDNI